MKLLFVFLGGGLGSILRYAVSRLFLILNLSFPLGTLVANIISSFILGLLVGYTINNNMSENYRLLFMVGLCGGFSTFSTFSYESFDMLKNGYYLLSLSYIVISLILCILSIALGIKIMQ